MLNYSRYWSIFIRYIFIPVIYINMFINYILVYFEAIKRKRIILKLQTSKIIWMTCDVTLLYKVQQDQSNIHHYLTHASSQTNYSKDSYGHLSAIRLYFCQYNQISKSLLNRKIVGLYDDGFQLKYKAFHRSIWPLKNTTSHNST